MTTAEEAIDAYLAAWNERDGATRAALLVRAVTDDCELAAPTGIFRGRQAIARLVAALQARMGDAVLARVGPVVEAPDLRFGWEVRSAGGNPVMAGTDVVELADDGRLHRIQVAL